MSYLLESARGSFSRSLLQLQARNVTKRKEIEK